MFTFHAYHDYQPTRKIPRFLRTCFLHASEILGDCMHLFYSVDHRYLAGIEKFTEEYYSIEKKRS